MEQEGSGYSLDVSKPDIGGLTEVKAVDTGCKGDVIQQPVDLANTLEAQIAGNNQPVSNTVSPDAQVGGGDSYQYIYDPFTGSKHLTNSGMGKTLLKNYVKMYNLINK